MRVLLADADPALGDVVADELHEAGHDVVRCFGPGDTMLCRGANLMDDCPLDAGDVCAAVLVRRNGEEPLLREMGAVCAVRRRLPVVETGADLTGIVATVESAAAERLAGHEAAVEAVIVSLPAVATLGHLPGVRVQRHGRRMLLTLIVPEAMDEADRTSIVTWSVRGLRAYDPHPSTLDVVIDTTP